MTHELVDDAKAPGGLDPESAQAVLRMIRDMTEVGHTVILCTHHLVEAEGLADHIVVLDDGTEGAFLLAFTSIFADGFESGDTSAWSSVIP